MLSPRHHHRRYLHPHCPIRLHSDLCAISIPTCRRRSRALRPLLSFSLSLSCSPSTPSYFFLHFLSASLFPFLSASRVRGFWLWPGCDAGCGWAAVVFRGSWVSPVVRGGSLRWFGEWVLQFDMVQKCNQGTEALKLLTKGSKKKFDIILTERCMPDIEESRLIKILSENTDLAPVIVMSKSGNNNTMKDCINYGAYDYLVKPIQREEVKKLWIPAFRQRIRMRNEVPQTDEKKKIRRVWSLDENEKFAESYEEVKKGGGWPTPKRMIENLNGKGLKDLTPMEVSSKLQKYRKKIGEVGTSSNQLNLSTQHLAAGSMSLGPHKITPNFQNVQVNVHHSNTDKMTQTLSSHERPCNEMSNIIQDQVMAGNVDGISFFLPPESPDRDLHEALEHILGLQDLSKGHPIPNISQDQAAAENVAGNYSFMPNINTSLQSSSQDCNNNMDYTSCAVHNPELNEGLPSFMLEDGTWEANNIQEQAVGNYLTHFSETWPCNYFY